MGLKMRLNALKNKKNYKNKRGPLPPSINSFLINKFYFDPDPFPEDPSDSLNIHRLTYLFPGLILLSL
jgi:hypothetical protein|tara:strand:- start:3611 stop:3814 length:204 start_codon:yes stop_codon:yes gene_type:complete